MKKYWIFILLTLTLKVTGQISDGLVGHWPLNSNANDISANELHGIENGVTSCEDRQGSTSGAYSFNGISNFITLQHTDEFNFGTGSFAISVWINTNQSTYGTIASKYIGVTGFVYYIAAGTGNQLFYYGDGNAVPGLSNTAITDGDWHHIVVNVDKNEDLVKFYLDGNPDGYFSISDITGSINTTQNLYLGKYNNDQFFEGSLDDFMLYNRVLTEAEIQALYTNTEVPDPQTNTLLWQEDDNGNVYTLDKNLGINTDAPTSRLHIKQNSDQPNEGIQIQSSDNYSGFIFRMSGENSPLTLRNTGVNTLFINNGMLGIGMSEPVHMLDIANGSDGPTSIRLQNGARGINAGLILESGGTSFNGGQIRTNSTHNFNFIINNTGTGDYRVGIGITNPQSALAVNGTIETTRIEVKADLSAGGNIESSTVNTGKLYLYDDVPSSDYVFDSDYELMELSKLEAFVIENKHLPEIPSAKEFKAQGYNVGEMDDLLLRKIEELTLYILEQQKTIDELQKTLKNLK